MAATSLSLSPTLTVRLRPHAFYPTQSYMQAFCKKKVILKLNKNNHRKRFNPPRYRNMPLLRRFCFCCFHLNRTERPKEWWTWWDFWLSLTCITLFPSIISCLEGTVRVRLNKEGWPFKPPLNWATYPILGSRFFVLSLSVSETFRYLYFFFLCLRDVIQSTWPIPRGREVVGRSSRSDRQFVCACLSSYLS